jgi:hypothetical protein
MNNSTTSSTSTAAIPSILVVPIREKLMKANYPLWSAQVLPAIHAAQLDDLLTDADLSLEKELTTFVDDKLVKSCNSMYSSSVARDQAILEYLLSTLTRQTLQHVSRCSTSAQAWHMLANIYSLQSRALSVNTCIALATTKKNQLSVTDYYSKMTRYADELVASGAPLHDNELVAYHLVGLEEDYNLVFTTIVTRDDPISPNDLYAQLLSFEKHTHLQANASSGTSLSAMATNRGCGFSGCGSRGYD